MTGRLTPTEFRKGLEKQFNEELTQRCIRYGEIEGASMTFDIELTDKALMLAGALAIACEWEERYDL